MLDFIDGIIYINLDERTDRKQHLLSELARIPGFADSDLSRRVYRFPAIKGETHQERIIGCAESHGQALKFALDCNFKNVLILEDDFTWSEDAAHQCRRFDHFWRQFQNKFGMVQLASVIYQGTQMPEPNLDFPIGIMHVEETSNAAGYFVDRSMMKDLSDLILHAAEQLKVHNMPEFFVNDRCWNLLRNTYKTYAFHPRMGYQMADYSSIRQQQVTEKL